MPLPVPAAAGPMQEPGLPLSASSQDEQHRAEDPLPCCGQAAVCDCTRRASRPSACCSLGTCPS